MNQSEKIIKYIYLISLLFLVLSGFGQMPVFKRYYIADIPGFAWLAQFYVTHAMHYIFAAILIALSSYAVVDHLLDKNKDRKMTATGYTKTVMLLGLMLTGSLMVFKNLPGTYFPHVVIILLDLAHITLCMTLLFYSLYTIIAGKQWVRHPIKDILQKLE